jgi:outer membrane receptor for ferrienterochelin and colicins
MKKVVLLLVIFVFHFKVIAQDEISHIYSYDLTELSNLTVITATKSLQKLSEIPATVRIITAEDIKENAYFTIEDALSDLPGFQFRDLIGFNSYIFQRGIPSQNNKILILVDGIQINELNSGGFYGGAQYNLSNVRQIEVVYGPASALYGTNAMSGIVNIITKDLKDNKGIGASVSYGSFNTLNADLSYGYYNEERDLGIAVSGMYKTSEKADLGGILGDNNWTEEMENFEDDYAIDAKFKYKGLTIGSNNQLKLSSTSSSYKTTGTNYIDRNSSWNIIFLNSYIDYLRSFSDKLNIQSKIYYRNATVLNNTVDEVFDTAQVGYYRPNDLYGFESNLNYFPNNKFNVIGGIVIEREKLAEGFSKTWSSSSEEKPPTPTKPSMQNNELWSIYLQSQYHIIESLQVTLGARLDNSSVYDRIITPRTGLVYNHNRFTAKLLYTEAFRAPKPWDYTDGIGNSGLEPETMQSFEFATTYNYSKNSKINLSVYKNFMDGVLTRENGGDNWHWINSGELKTDGAELSIDHRKGRIKSYFNYTYNFSYDENKEIIPEIAKSDVNAGIVYAVTDKIKLNLRGHYLGERKNPSTITSTGSDYIDPALILYGTTSYMIIKNLDISLICKNLLDTEYYHTSNRTVERYRQPQRTIIIRAGYSFE